MKARDLVTSVVYLLMLSRWAKVHIAFGRELLGVASLIL